MRDRIRNGIMEPRGSKPVDFLQARHFAHKRMAPLRVWGAAAAMTGIFCAMMALQQSSSVLLKQRAPAQDFATPGGGVPGPVLNVKHAGFALGGAAALKRVMHGRVQRLVAKQQALARGRNVVFAPGDSRGDPKSARRVPLGPRENVWVHILPPAKLAKPVAAEFSHGTQELFKQLANEASHDLPEPGFTRPTYASGQLMDESPRGGLSVARTEAGLPGAATYTGGSPDFASELAHSLDGIGFEQDRFHFAPEMGSNWNGR